MTDKAISPLRRRMIDDMTIRKLGPKTQAGYIRAVKNFADFLGRSPNQANAEDIRRYQLHLASSSLRPIGRPALKRKKLDAAPAALADGQSIRAAALAAGISVGSAAALRKAMAG